MVKLLRWLIVPLALAMSVAFLAGAADAEQVSVRADGDIKKIVADHSARKVTFTVRGGMPTELILRVKAKRGRSVEQFSVLWFDEGAEFTVYEGKGFTKVRCSQADNITWAGDLATYRMSFSRRCFGNPQSLRVMGVAKPDPSFGDPVSRTPWTRWAARG